MATPDQAFAAAIEAAVEAPVVASGPQASMPVFVPDAVAVLVAIRAAGHLVRPREVRCTGILDRPAGGWTRHHRARMVAAVSQGGQAWVGGHLVTEPVGAQRWLAWFPRPLGPHHALNMPSPAVPAIVARVPGLELVRAHLAVRAWQAEVLQAAGNLVRFEAGRTRLRRWVERGGETDDETARWATVVEVVGDDDQLVRGWAHGRRRATTARAIARRLEAMPWDDATSAAAVLDDVAVGDDGDLRWSVGRPQPIEH